MKLHDDDHWLKNDGNPYAVWKMIAGQKVTHLPEHCLVHMSPDLCAKIFDPHRHAPQVLDFGPHYESVLEYFTERMLGLYDCVPDEKKGLLNKLFDETGFQR